MEDLPKGIDHSFCSKGIVQGTLITSGKLQFPLKLPEIVLKFAFFVGIDVPNTLVFPTVCGIKKDNRGQKQDHTGHLQKYFGKEFQSSTSSR